MSERKERFTPGPWMAHCESDFSSVLAGDDQNTEVCYCECQFTDDEQRTVAHNAMLIATAPDLYSDEKDKIVHLQTLKNQIRELFSPSKMMPTILSIGFVMQYIDEIIDDTEKLLAKARGEESNA